MNLSVVLILNGDMVAKPLAFGYGGPQGEA